MMGMDGVGMCWENIEIFIYDDCLMRLLILPEIILSINSMSCLTAYCPQYFFGYIGVASALIFANLGAAYGSAKAGVGICSMGVLKPELIMKSVVPVVMAGILGIYGMIVAVIIVQRSNTPSIQSLQLNIQISRHMRIWLRDCAVDSARS